MIARDTVDGNAALSGITWKKLKRDKAAVAAMTVILVMLLVAIFAFVIIPDKTTFSDRRFPQIGNQPPGFEVTIFRIAGNKKEGGTGFFSRIFTGEDDNDRYIPVRNKRFEGTDIIVSEFSPSGDSSFESSFNIADVVYPINPDKKMVERNGGLFFETADGVSIEESINDIHAIIDGQHFFRKKFILGTDRFGRDIFSRLIAAKRATLFTAFVVSVMALFLGLFTGLAGALVRGRVRHAVSWLVYAMASIPGMLLSMAVVFVTGNGFPAVCLAASLALAPQVAVIVINIFARMRTRQFVTSAYALGLTRWQVTKRHIFPELVTPLVSCWFTLLPAAVLIESSLNFLGIGFEDPLPSWGTMVRENFGYIIIDGFSYATLLPGFAILTVAFFFTLLSGRLQKLSRENYSHVLV